MMRVIIVDDERWNRDMIRTLGDWESWGMEIAGEAEDGASALALAETAKPDILITDMKMPGTDGIWLLEQIRQLVPNIQIVVVSGYDDFKYTKHAVRQQAVEYLLKPIDPVELNETLGRCKTLVEQARSQAPSRLASLDRVAQQSLSGMKHLLRLHFNNLHEEGIRSVFARLAQELGRVDGESEALVERVRHELLLLLAELLAANGLEPEEEGADAVRHETIDQSSLLLADRYCEAMHRVAQDRKHKHKLNLEEVRAYIELHFAEPLSLEQLARVFFVSKEYLSKLFKQTYGVTVMDYVLQRKMEQAKAWLEQEELSIKTIAEMTGYEDMSYFYRVFKKHYGIAPGEMRKQSQS
ncbi:DNA-binding response regulator [Paenibacillus sp. 598K]|uniref:response regulator n=1 Tax=Paenibacillus sp. 598K TaxID=1117987 RepID=UPI000FF95C23|nr:response regulator [Paenibacillus sp. 598K]GBF74897.1 DNA-binding response regulator [Paenibacillus sp. 598K]